MQRARNTDPITSHLAAKDTQEMAEKQRIEMLVFVVENSGHTSNELGELSNKYDRYQFGRRLSELRTEGLVANLHERPCGITGRKAMTWCAV
jgi:hypothetical protein